MALFIECMLKCAPILIDNADIVREAMLRQLTVRSGVNGKTAGRWDCFRVPDHSEIGRRPGRAGGT
jgi:hypothetical protein